MGQKFQSRDKMPISESTVKQGCHIHFLKKGQNQPTKLLKKAKHSIKNSQTFNLTKPNLINNLLPHNSNSHKNTSYALTAPPQKAINSKLFLEFVTYGRKTPKFFSF